MNSENFIGKTMLFKGLPGAQLNELSRILVSCSFKRGQTIFSDGEEANGFYILRSGRVKIFKLSFDGKEQILHIIGPDEPFGEVPVFAGEKFPAYAEPLEESEAVFFPKAAFVGLIRKDPQIAMNMLAILSKRLKQFTHLVESLSLKEVPQRLATYLLHLRGDTGSEIVDLNIAKGQLASILGTIPETLSRILSKMVNQDLIRVQGRTIRLIDPNGLEDLASGEKVLV